ncbi:MAG: adenylate/guanylate cyclase domain-containing protein [Pseudomonadota bacterium]
MSKKENWTEAVNPQEELRTFLGLHGLDQYFDTMAAEDISVAMLRELEEADFKELGLTMGHRKTLRKALEEGETVDKDRTDQRRQVTVLFCDMVGSTDLASRYDAEDMADIFDRYHRHVNQVIEAHGGRPLYTQGDGIIACFGYPKAAEDDAERATRAALAISREIPAMQFSDALVLHTRVGIATGRVFVRGQVRDSSGLVGDTLHLASRLQDEAPTDGVVVGSNTKRLIARVADLTALGERRLKGFDTPVEVWSVNALRDVGDRQEDTQGLLGRNEEFARIQELWTKAQGGDGQVLVVSGEPGIGKSHLLAAARDLAAETDAATMRIYCGANYTNSTLFPLRTQFMRMFGLGDTAEAAEVAEKVVAGIGSDDPTSVRLMADLMSLNPGPDFPPLDMTAIQHRVATFALVQEHMASWGADGPLLVLMEDAHWADPTTLELLAAIVAGTIPGRSIFLIVSMRPLIELSWPDADHVSHMTLDRLSEAESRAVVDRVMGGRAIPPEILLTIIEAADGVPLFIEELSRSVMEQSEQASGSFVGVSVPITLEDSLMARLDRLSSGKDVVQTAAVFGRRFPTPAVRQLLDMEPVNFNIAVAEPVEARILQSIDTGADMDVMHFRHALVQQAAYEGIARKQRQSLHARIATLLLEHQPTVAETEPETLARHYAGAGNPGQAITYLMAAGKLAASRAAQVEATNHFLAALDLLDQLPDGRQKDEAEVALRALLGGALMATRGFAAPEVYDAFARARELCHSLGDSPIYCAALYGLWTVAASRSNRAEAFELAEEMMSGFGAGPVPSWTIAAHFAKATTCFFAGDLDQAEVLFDTAISSYTEDQHGLLVEQFGDNLVEFSMCYRSWIHIIRGEFGASEALLQRANEMADVLNNKNAQARAAAFQMGRYLDLGQVAEVADRAPKLIELSTVQGYPYWTCAGQIGLGWAMALAGNADGIAPIAGSIGFFDMIGQKTPQTYWRSFQIAGHAALGQRDEALAAADTALAMSDAGLDSMFEPLLLWCKGNALRTEPSDVTAAETALRRALSSAQEIGAHFHAFLAALSLAELLQADGRGADEGGALAKAIAAIEDIDIPAMDRARAVLAAL